MAAPLAATDRHHPVVVAPPDRRSPTRRTRTARCSRTGRSSRGCSAGSSTDDLGRCVGLAPAFTSRATLVAAPLTPLDPRRRRRRRQRTRSPTSATARGAGLPRAGVGMCTEGGGGDVWLQPGVDHQCHNCHVCDDRTALPFDALCPRPTVIPGELRPHCAGGQPAAAAAAAACLHRRRDVRGARAPRRRRRARPPLARRRRLVVLGGAPFSFWSGLDDIAPAAGPAAGHTLVRLRGRALLPPARTPPPSRRRRRRRRRRRASSPAGIPYFVDPYIMSPPPPSPSPPPPTSPSPPPAPPPSLPPPSSPPEPPPSPPPSPPARRRRRRHPRRPRPWAAATRRRQRRLLPPAGADSPLRVLVWQHERTRDSPPPTARWSAWRRRWSCRRRSAACCAPSSLAVARRRRHLRTRLCSRMRTTPAPTGGAHVAARRGAAPRRRGRHASRRRLRPRRLARRDARLRLWRRRRPRDTPRARRAPLHRADGWRRARPPPSSASSSAGLRAGAADDEYAPPAAQSARLLLLGVARQSHGELRLTSAEAAHAMASAWVLPRLARPPLTHFTLRFDLLMGGGSLSPTPADGMSVVYAPPTRAPFGELGPPPGGGSGLVVRLRTLRAGSAWRSSSTAPSSRRPTRAICSTPNLAWAAFALEVDAGRGVTLWYRQSPSSATRRSAPRGHRATAQACRPRRARRRGGLPPPRASRRLASPLLAAGTRVPVEVSFNSIDFSSGGPEIAYAAPPVVSLVLPAAGPAAGGSAVTLRGPGLCATLLRCRIGAALVNATAAACAPASPPPPSPRRRRRRTARPSPCRGRRRRRRSLRSSATPHSWSDAARRRGARRAGGRGARRRRRRRGVARLPPLWQPVARRGGAFRLLATGVGSAAPVDRPPQWGDSRAHPRRRRRRAARRRRARRAARRARDGRRCGGRLPLRPARGARGPRGRRGRGSACTSPAAASAVERAAFPAGTFNVERAGVRRPAARRLVGRAVRALRRRRRRGTARALGARAAPSPSLPTHARCGGGAAAAAAPTIGPTAVWVSLNGQRWARRSSATRPPARATLCRRARRICRRCRSTPRSGRRRAPPSSLCRRRT